MQGVKNVALVPGAWADGSSWSKIIPLLKAEGLHAILATPIKNAAWHSKPSWFVIASNDRTISPEQEASTAKRMGAKTLVLPSSHVPMLSHPQKVADLVLEAAASLVPSAAVAAD